MSKIFTLFLAVSVIAALSAPLAARGENSLFTKMVVKQRAERYADTGGVSSGSREMYVYANDDDIAATLDAIKQNRHSLQSDDVAIVSPSIDKDSKIRKVTIVVDAKKGIKVNRTSLGIRNQEISIANPVIENGSKVKQVNILVDAKNGGVEVK